MELVYKFDEKSYCECLKQIHITHLLQPGYHILYGQIWPAIYTVIVQDGASSEMREIHLGCFHHPDSSSLSSLSSVASSTDVRMPKKSA